MLGTDKYLSAVHKRYRENALTAMSLFTEEVAIYDKISENSE